jgi:hypothetical protein
VTKNANQRIRELNRLLPIRAVQFVVAAQNLKVTRRPALFGRQPELFNQSHKAPQCQVETLPGYRMQGVCGIAYQRHSRPYELINRSQFQGVMVTLTNPGKPAQAPTKPLLEPLAFIAVRHCQNTFELFIAQRPQQR